MNHNPNDDPHSFQPHPSPLESLSHNFTYISATEQKFTYCNCEADFEGLAASLGCDEELVCPVQVDGETILVCSPYLMDIINKATTLPGPADDETLALNYHRTRHYDPSVGRWLTDDPVWFDSPGENLNRNDGNALGNSDEDSDVDAEETPDP